jgi:hypothetical protein
MEHDDQTLNPDFRQQFMERLAKMHDEGFDVCNLKYALGEAHDLTEELINLCNGDRKMASMILCVVEGVLAVGTGVNLSDRERIRYKSHGRELARLVLRNEELEDQKGDA